MRAVACACLVAALAGGPAHAQEPTPRNPKDLLADLGDPDRGEAAERAMLADLPRAMPVLVELFTAWCTTTTRDVDRLRAALRVVHLAGRDAGDALPPLLGLAEARRPVLSDERAAAVVAMLPHEAAAQHRAMRVLLLLSPDDMQRRVELHARMSKRRSTVIPDAEAARLALAADELGAREVACEVLATSGDERDVTELRERLLARERPPKHEIRHNGFLVDARDEFPLRASLAMVRLAPGAPECAIAYANLALVHPHRTVRLESLRSLAACGPAVADAIPELLQLAEGADEQPAAAALQAMLAVCAQLGPHAPRIEALQRNRPPAVAERAAKLLARLRDLAIPVTAPPADKNGESLRDAVAMLNDIASPAARAAADELLRAGPRAWPFLVERYRRELNKAPDRLLELLGLIGRTLPPDDHADIRVALMILGDHWQFGAGSMFSSSSDKVSRARCDAYARLTIGPPSPSALASALTHDNPVVRRFAAGEAAADASHTSAPGGNQLIAALLVAARGDHPTKVRTAGDWSSFDLDLTDEMRRHAATALLAVELPDSDAAAMFAVLVTHPDAAVLVRALERWGGAIDRTRLEQLAADKRVLVAKAASAALARRRPAPPVPAGETTRSR